MHDNKYSRLTNYMHNNFGGTDNNTNTYIAYVAKYNGLEARQDCNKPSAIAMKLLQFYV